MHENRTIADRIVEALPGATVRETDRGYQVGGFSMPPVVAQRTLRDAGLIVSDFWGATIVDFYAAHEA